MNRIAAFLPDDRSPADRVKRAAYELEAAYAAEVRAAASGAKFDPEDLIAHGASIGRPPYIVFADVRLASSAFEAWQKSVPSYFG